MRSIIHRMGFRFSLHNKRLPGNPDIVLTRHKRIVLVHGCFWHQHHDCPKAKRPTSNKGFWNDKLDANVRRDDLTQRLLTQLGWRCLVVWECEVANNDCLIRKMEKFLDV